VLADRSGLPRVPAAAATPITEVDLAEHVPRPTGVAELDRVLGGGLVAGSVTLLGGEPGIGKSTLVTQVAASVAGAGERVLYVSAEESRQQVRLRAERLGALVAGLWLTSAYSLPELVEQLDEVGPSLVVVDSIQTLLDPGTAGTAGSMSQVRSCAQVLVQLAKERAMAVVLVGHVTKDGELAGPRVLEHVVDTVLGFEGDRHHALRLLRTVKHRFGPAGELGLFELTDRGLVGVPDAGALLLADRRPGVPGSAVVPAMEGSRPLLVEVQALVDDGEHPNPRRSAQGIEARRLATVVAVLEQRLGLKLRGSDVFALAAGGVKVHEPAADLALAMALVSSREGVAVPPDLVVCGELGLGGEVRQVSHLGRRLHEAARLGFRRALVPPSAPAVVEGIELLRTPTVAHAASLIC
jgi:DNA repair protein RadA/Sms